MRYSRSADLEAFRKAVAVYREVIQKYPKTNSMTEAQVRLAELTDGKM